jgi:hypothetical protein
VTAAEAADKQFLANLERVEGGQSAAATPTVEVVKPAPAPVAEGPAVKKETRVAKKPAREVAPTAVVPRESTVREPAKVATATKKSSSRVSLTRREEAPARVEAVEIRRAVPVTTTVVTTIRRDRAEDDDHDDDDHDRDRNHGNGFFNRLFSGER